MRFYFTLIVLLLSANIFAAHWTNKTQDRATSIKHTLTIHDHPILNEACFIFNQYIHSHSLTYFSQSSHKDSLAEYYKGRNIIRPTKICPFKIETEKDLSETIAFLDAILELPAEIKNLIESSFDPHASRSHNQSLIASIPKRAPLEHNKKGAKPEPSAKDSLKSEARLPKSKGCDDNFFPPHASLETILTASSKNSNGRTDTYRTTPGPQREPTKSNENQLIQASALPPLVDKSVAYSEAGHVSVKLDLTFYAFEQGNISFSMHAEVPPLATVGELMEDLRIFFTIAWVSADPGSEYRPKSHYIKGLLEPSIAERLRDNMHNGIDIPKIKTLDNTLISNDFVINNLLNSNDKTSIPHKNDSEKTVTTLIIESFLPRMIPIKCLAILLNFDYLYRFYDSFENFIEEFKEQASLMNINNPKYIIYIYEKAETRNKISDPSSIDIDDLMKQIYHSYCIKIKLKSNWRFSHLKGKYQDFALLSLDNHDSIQENSIFIFKKNNNCLHHYIFSASYPAPDELKNIYKNQQLGDVPTIHAPMEISDEASLIKLLDKFEGCASFLNSNIRNAILSLLEQNETLENMPSIAPKIHLPSSNKEIMYIAKANFIAHRPKESTFFGTIFFDPQSPQNFVDTIIQHATNKGITYSKILIGYPKFGEKTYNIEDLKKIDIKNDEQNTIGLIYHSDLLYIFFK